jgi:hypothetical protein
MLMNQPPFTTGRLALSRPIPYSLLPRDNVPVYYRLPKKLTAGDRTTRDIMARKLVKDLRSKSGFAYQAALKYVTQLALPRMEGTLTRRSAHPELAYFERMERLAGMVC